MSNIIVSHRMRAAAVTAVIVALGIVGCTTTTNTPAPVQSAESTPIPEIEPAPDLPTRDEIAQDAAASIDPVFADAEVWVAAKETAHNLCDLADMDPDTAVVTSLTLAIESGVTAEQIGVIWGVATSLYCPEYEGLVG